MYVSKRDGICEKAGLIYLCAREPPKGKRGKEWKRKKSGLRNGQGYCWGVRCFCASKKSGQGRAARLGAYTSLAPDECVSLSESDIKTPDGPCSAFFPALGWERESMRVRDI